MLITLHERFIIISSCHYIACKSLKVALITLLLCTYTKDFLSKTVLVKDGRRNSHETQFAKKLNVIDPSNSHSMVSFH